MTAQAVETVVAQLADAGLNLSLAPAGGLAVAPSSQLTADLRTLIRSSKALLIDWLRAENDTASQAPDPPDDPVDWKKLAAAYHAHHFHCPTCIAAGQGYGQRCAEGAPLWMHFQGGLDTLDAKQSADLLTQLQRRDGFTDLFT